MNALPPRLARILIFTAILAVANGVQAGALEDENLLQGLPDGFTVGHSTQRAGLTMVEYVPAAESVENWSQMVTTQIFHGNPKSLPDFFGTLQQSWSGACEGAVVTPIRDGEENGYAFALWMFSCPFNAATGKPEMTWMKGIRGNDALYVVQWAFRTEPSEDDVRRSIGYLRGVMVCDTRIERSPCPSLAPEAAETGLAD